MTEMAYQKPHATCGDAANSRTNNECAGRDPELLVGPAPKGYLAPAWQLQRAFADLRTRFMESLTAVKGDISNERKDNAPAPA